MCQGRCLKRARRFTPARPGGCSRPYARAECGLHQDIQPNRLEYAKLLLSKIFDSMSEDRVGLIVFAGDAYVQLPLTSDNVSAKMFLSSISTKMAKW